MYRYRENVSLGASMLRHSTHQIIQQTCNTLCICNTHFISFYSRLFLCFMEQSYAHNLFGTGAIHFNNSEKKVKEVWGRVKGFNPGYTQIVEGREK